MWARPWKLVFQTQRRKGGPSIWRVAHRPVHSPQMLLLLVSAVFVGLGATLLIDLWALFLRRTFGIPSLNYCLLGRWVLYMADRKIAHESIAATPQKAHECTIGWISHYSIGSAFALLFVLLASDNWLARPTLLPALAFGIATVLVPFFVMQPAFGLGVAASKTPSPNKARLKSVMTHAVFGAGLYLSARLLLVLQASALSAQSLAKSSYDRVILGGRVMDPESGLDAARNIGLRDGRIAVITTQAITGRDTIDARGLVVAPGFIDIHAHGQTPETYRFYGLDGVTTALELELGTSDVARWYRERSTGQLINYGVSIGHIKVRMSVMHDSGTVMPVSDGAYRAATSAQIREIANRIETGLSEGAVDIGAGFPYTPAATRDELLAVFRVAARTKTPLHVHIRPGVAGLRDALALAAETNAPLHVVHINSAALSETPVMLEMIRDARARGRDVTTEAYPYDAGMTEIQSATIQDIYRSAPDDSLADLEWPTTGERLNRESFARYSRIGGPIVVHTNTEQMVAVAITSPLTIIASDAYWQNGTGHPRTTGTFAKVLGRYVRDTRALPLMEAISKMTLLPAQRLQARVPAMKQKGRLRVGADADITIFDPATVIDRSTYREPSLSPVGVQHVIVNGVSVVANGRTVDGVTPGKPLRGPIDRR